MKEKNTEASIKYCRSETVVSTFSYIYDVEGLCFTYQKHRTLILIDSFVKWYKKGIWNCGILVWYFWENDFIWGVIRFADGRDMIVSSLMGGIEWQSNCRHPIMIRKSSTRVKSRLMLILSYKLLVARSHQIYIGIDLWIFCLE